MVEPSTTDRPPIAAADITADVICETADRLGIRLTRAWYYVRKDLVPSGHPFGCALGLAAIARQPRLAENESISYSEIVKAVPNFDLRKGIEDGFHSLALVVDPSPVYLRGFAIGREVTRRAGLEE